MIGKIKNFAVKKLLERQLRNAPPQQRQMIMTLLEKDPKLFGQIAKEIQQETKRGLTDVQAAMKVLPKYQSQIAAVLGNKALSAGAVKFNPNGSIRR